MEFLVYLVTIVPEGTTQEEVDNRRAAEAVRAAELAKAGHLVRLWRPPLCPTRMAEHGLFTADDEAEMQEILTSLPLHVWMKVSVTALNPHPNDPK